MSPRSTSRSTSWTISHACRPHTGGGSAPRAAAGHSARSARPVLVLRWFRERGCVHCLAFILGARGALLITSLPSAVEDGVEGLPVFAVAVTEQEPQGYSIPHAEVGGSA